MTRVGLSSPFRVAVALAALTIVACQRHSPVVESVVVTPSSVFLEPGQTQQFSAEVRGKGRPSQQVWWYAGRLEGGGEGGSPAVGTIDSDGTYRAPAVSPATAIMIEARSVADPGKTGKAVVSMPARAVTISPQGPHLELGATQRFAATVSGSLDQTVWWHADQGSIDASGLYTAPAVAFIHDNVRVYALGLETTTEVYLRPAPPRIDALSGPAAAQETLVVYGSGFAETVVGPNVVTVVFPAAGGGVLRADATSATPTELSVVVPIGATSGPLYLERQLGHLDLVTSNEMAFERRPRLRLRAERIDLAAGESTRLSVAYLGAPGPAPLTYSADAGVAADGVYTAPATVAATALAHVTACIEGTPTCDGLAIRVHPFGVSPEPVLVPAGGSIALAAHAGGAPVGATWQVASGGGSIAADGVYTSSAAVEDAGLTWLVASAAGTTEAFQAGVTGLGPGLLRRTIDHPDYTVPTPFGWFARKMAVDGNRAYVLASAVDPYGGNYFSYAWIDVYDVTDPVQPVWQAAVESVSLPTVLVAAYGRLYAFGNRDYTADDHDTLAVYDISESLPKLLLRDTADTWFARGIVGPAFDGDHAFVFEEPALGRAVVPMRIYDTASGTLTLVRTLELQLPAEADPISPLQDATAWGDRAYVSYATQSPSSRLAAYDLSSEFPTLIGSVEGPAYGPRVVGPLLLAGVGFGASTTMIYDRSAGVPRLIASLPLAGEVVPSSGSLVALATITGDTSILDVSDPATPTVTASYNGSASAWVGDHVLAVEGLGGLATYDGARAGGPIVRARLDIPPPSGATYLYAAAAGPSRVYATGEAEAIGGVIAAWDTSADPPAAVFVRKLAGPGYALAALGAHLAVGTASTLEFLDVSPAGDPVQVAVLLIPASCLAVDGSNLYVGTLTGELLVLDVSDPLGPLERGRLSLPAAPYAFQTAGPGLLLAAAPGAGLLLVDVANPAAPFLRSALDVGSPAYGVALTGSTAWIAARGGVVTADVSDPDRPVLLAQALLVGSPYNPTYDPETGFTVAAHRGIAYVGTSGTSRLSAIGATVQGFDVRFPAAPRLVSLRAFSPYENSFVGALAFDGTTLYAAGHFGGAFALAQVDATQPRNLIVLPAPTLGLR